MKIQKSIILFFILLHLSFILAEGTSFSPSDASVVVDSQAPQIAILSPLNQTYNNAEPILINYSIFDPTLESIWYSLNEVQNITITNPFTLNLGEGPQHLILYANDSFGRVNSSEVYFTTEYSSLPSCGDNSCDSNEDCANCPYDCGNCPPANGTPNQSQTGQQEAPLKANFSIDKKELKISLSPGEKADQTLIIKNTGEKTIKITIFVPVILRNFITLSEESFFLKLEDEKNIDIKFNIPETAEFNVHAGEILISGLGVEKKLPVTIEIESKDSLFDIILKLPPELTAVRPGGELTANIEITDIGEAGLVNATLNTVIKDFEGNILVEESENLSVNKKLILNKALKIPSNAKPGKYIIYAIITYDEKSATSSQEFEIIKKYSWEMFALIGLIVIALLAIIIGYFIINFPRNKKKETKSITKRKQKNTRNK